MGTRKPRWRYDLPDPRRLGALDILQWALVAVLLVVFLLPIAYALSISLRPRSEVFIGSVHFIPYRPTLDSWYLFLVEDGAWYLANSLLAAAGVTLLVVTIAVPGAYAFARLRFSGRRGLFYLVVLTVLVPSIVFLIPMILLAYFLNLYDTISGVWLAVVITSLPLSIWILRDNFMSLPGNPEECARIYGCTRLEAFVRVVLPLATPAIVTVAFIAFLLAWTEFLFTSRLTTLARAGTASVWLVDFVLGPELINWPLAMAGSFIIAIPPIAFYVFARGHLERALDL